MNITEKVEDNVVKISTNNEEKKAKKKVNKKKKKIKEKKCSGLKELLEQITAEKLAKKKKEEKEKEKDIKNKETTKKEEPLKNSSNSGIFFPIDNEDKSKDYQLNDHNIIVNGSLSGTTVATSSYDEFNEFQKFNYDKYSDSSNKCEYNDLRPNYMMKNVDMSEEDKKDEEFNFFKRRKISSPICDYYNGFDKILSITHKGSVDFNNSMNFIKKTDLISPFSSNICKNNNQNIKDENKNIDVNNNNKNINNINNEDDNNKISNEEINIDNKKNVFNNNQNYINMDDDYYYKMNYYYQYLDFYKYMPESKINSKFNMDNDNIEGIIDCNSKKQCKNNWSYKKNKKEKNKYSINKNNLFLRDGDWLCPVCLNLNFSFRNFCNRCGAPK